MSDADKIVPAPAAAPSAAYVDSYGAYPNGLICGYLFAGGAPGVAIDLAGALAWLANESAAGPGDFV
ncbi:MAG TPA: hypothetical protein VIP05_01475, partial [Burkholderiaceae bacterium]